MIGIVSDAPSMRLGIISGSAQAERQKKPCSKSSLGEYTTTGKLKKPKQEPFPADKSISGHFRPFPADKSVPTS